MELLAIQIIAMVLPFQTYYQLPLFFRTTSSDYVNNEGITLA